MLETAVIERFEREKSNEDLLRLQSIISDRDRRGKKVFLLNLELVEKSGANLIKDIVSQKKTKFALNFKHCIYLFRSNHSIIVKVYLQAYILLF